MEHQQKGQARPRSAHPLSRSNASNNHSRIHVQGGGYRWNSQGTEVQAGSAERLRRQVQVQRSLAAMQDEDQGANVNVDVDAVDDDEDVDVDGITPEEEVIAGIAYHSA